MPNRLQQRHWSVFKNISYVAQGPFGRAPANWAAGYAISSQGCPLPAHILTRQQVRAECQDPGKSVLHGYVCAMAWGLQGAAGRRAHVEAAWANRVDIAHRLTLLRGGGYTRQQAYDLFATSPIPGLGPSYFTKLVYFFRPDETIGYIMDQWTGKSIDLITGHHVVRMYGDAPTWLNTGANYDSFCRVIDFLAMQEGNTGDELEQRLFSQNGQYRQQRGAWRDHVRSQWATGRPAHRYDHEAMTEWVRGL